MLLTILPIFQEHRSVKRQRLSSHQDTCFDTQSCKEEDNNNNSDDPSPTRYPLTIENLTAKVAELRAEKQKARETKPDIDGQVRADGSK